MKTLKGRRSPRGFSEGERDYSDLSFDPNSIKFRASQHPGASAVAITTIPTKLSRLLRRRESSTIGGGGTSYRKGSARGGAETYRNASSMIIQNIKPHHS